MSDKFNNNEFEDIYSNTPKKEKFKVEIPDDDFQDISSFSDDYGSVGEVKYNSSANNRRRQEFSYSDPDEVYGNMIPDDPKNNKKSKSNHSIRTFIAVVLVLVIAFTGCVGFYGYSTAKKLVDGITVDESLAENVYISSSELYRDEEQVNILLIGTDAREKNVSSRSDTMMLMTIDYKNGQIKLTSFLRDTYVQIARENLRKEKLNAAYFRGGIQMLIDTLELNFKVDIPYYLIVDFEIFEAVVNELGGVDVDVTEREAKYINSKDHMTKKNKADFPEDISAGINHFTGGQALWYSRIRYLDSDFMRTQRQRKVIASIINEAKSQKISDLIGIAEKVMPMLRTNIPSDDTMSLGIEAIKQKAFTFEIVQHTVPADGTWSNRRISGVGDCLVIDMDENVSLLHNFLREKQTANE